MTPEEHQRREKYYDAAREAMNWNYGSLAPVVDALMAIADKEIDNALHTAAYTD